MKTFKNTFVIMMQTTRETPHFNFVADSHGIVEKGEREKKAKTTVQDLNLVDLMLSLLPAEI